jgi:hypothetical protein
MGEVPNYRRPHGALGGQTPYKRLCQKTQTQRVVNQRQSHKPRRMPSVGVETGQPAA